MYSSTITMQYEDGANEKKKKDEQQQRFQDNRPLKKTEVTALESLGEHEQPLIWFNIFGIALLHAVAFYGLFTRYNQAKFYTWCYEIFHIFVSGVGVTAGAHRLWAHRSYSAKLPLRILLATFFCMVGQTHMFKWIRDHRTHHKFTETKADPHDADRGFFFSHVGWLMMKRHPAVIEYGKKIDMSDVANDPVIQFFDKYYEINMSLLCFILPTLIPVYFWNERFDIAFFATLVRYVFMLNATFSVNSFAHMLGNKPYTNDVRAVENGWVSFFSLGEGWHNYHHAFPWDYKAAELPGTFSTNFIELMARIGWAYDLKSPSKDLIEKISQSKGDGTRSRAGKSD